MIKLKGNAKINLTLDILGKREDGYHEVSMVMQSIELHDTLEMEKTPEGILLDVDVPWLEADETNLAWKAADLMIRRFHLEGGVRIRLTKRIPIAAGLAGGSTDAAAVLRGMRELYGLGLSGEELCRLGAEIGSDIPFCLMGGTMLSTGRGEVLKRLPALPEMPVVLAKPKISVSTAWAYRNYDELGAKRHPDNEAVQRALAAGDGIAVSKLLCNVLESVTEKRYNIISEYKVMMMEQGALASMMSGSGPTVFALAESMEKARRIGAFMDEATEADVFVTRTIGGID